ncbi:D-lactate dehydrogenase [Acanthocystis turfacea Chlorella virus Canal-1]|nr:D-lactate dehydrogenase [Acanthocystis turfacea Chlorella virus Canal-1]
MGGDDSVGQVRQAGHVAVPLGNAVINRQVRPVGEEQAGLVLVDVHRCSCDCPGLECIDEVGGIDEAAASSVDDNRVLLHRLERILLDEVVVLLGQRAVQADHVGVLQHVAQGMVFHAHLLDVLALVDVVGDDAACHRLHELDELLGNLAGADDTDGPAGHLVADQALEGEVPGLDAGEDQLEVAAERHHMGEGELSHRPGGVGGHAVDHEAELLGVLDVQAVKPGAPEGDDLDIVLVEDVQDRRRQVIVHENIDSLAAGGEVRALGRQRDVEVERRAHLLERLEELLDIAAGREHGDRGLGSGESDRGH